MEFKVSTKKFLKNELLKITVIIIIFTLLISFIASFYFNIFVNNIIFGIFITMFVFIYKENKYYNDLLYIQENVIKLKKKKVYRSRNVTDKIVEEEYNVKKIEYFKEDLNQFVLYGNIEMKRNISKNQFFGGFYDLPEESKIVEKLIIRKNFEKEDEIRELLKSAVKSYENI